MHLLLVSDDAAEAERLQGLLRSADAALDLSIDVQPLAAVVASYEAGRHAAALLDLGPMDGDGLKQIEQLCRTASDLPIVVLSEDGDERLGLIALREGAQDYLQKAELGGAVLLRCLRFAAERHRLQSRIHHLAYHDDLTGLANRTLFSDRLEQLLERINRQGQMLAVHFLDLDRFKKINDTHGHQTGDRLLCAVGRRIKTVLRATDTVARLGGDEFAILQSDIADRRAAAQLAERVIEAIARPFDLDGISIETRATIGLAIGPEDGDDAETLLRLADEALYVGKNAGRNTYRFHTAGIADGAPDTNATQPSAPPAARPAEERR